eukprot:GHVN01034230.1.p2 GENE.GHVN01034230.1~~GHVN01034230.1.p2  ORF type:complete len:619 (-),score=100.00 GHVN01034230.1:3522-5378(-)
MHTAGISYTDKVGAKFGNAVSINQDDTQDKTGFVKQPDPKTTAGEIQQGVPARQPSVARNPDLDRTEARHLPTEENAPAPQSPTDQGKAGRSQKHPTDMNKRIVEEPNFVSSSEKQIRSEVKTDNEKGVLPMGKGIDLSQDTQQAGSDIRRVSPPLSNKTNQGEVSLPKFNPAIGVLGETKANELQVQTAQIPTEAKKPQTSDPAPLLRPEAAGVASEAQKASYLAQFSSITLTLTEPPQRITIINSDPALQVGQSTVIGAGVSPRATYTKLEEDRLTQLPAPNRAGENGVGQSQAPAEGGASSLSKTGKSPVEQPGEVPEASPPPHAAYGGGQSTAIGALPLAGQAPPTSLDAEGATQPRAPSRTVEHDVGQSQAPSDPGATSISKTATDGAERLGQPPEASPRNAIGGGDQSNFINVIGALPPPSQARPPNLDAYGFKKPQAPPRAGDDGAGQSQAPEASPPPKVTAVDATLMPFEPGKAGGAVGGALDSAGSQGGGAEVKPQSFGVAQSTDPIENTNDAPGTHPLDIPPPPDPAPKPTQAPATTLLDPTKESVEIPALRPLPTIPTLATQPPPHILEKEPMVTTALTNGGKQQSTHQAPSMPHNATATSSKQNSR